MIRAVTVALLVAAVALSASTADASSAANNRIRRIGRARASATVTCAADAMERAMESARAGNSDWWDKVKDGLKDGVNAVGDAAVITGKAIGKATIVTGQAIGDAAVVSAGAVADAAKVTVDALNFVKYWECQRCDMCKKFSKDLAAKIISELVNAPSGVVSSTVCLGFDTITTGVCMAMCAPIPVPGLCPIVCPPFVIFAHTQCSGIVSNVMAEITHSKALEKKLKEKTLQMADVAGLSPDNMCKALDLCPIKRNDCVGLKPPTANPAPASSAPAPHAAPHTNVAPNSPSTPAPIVPLPKPAQAAPAAPSATAPKAAKPTHKKL